MRLALPRPKPWALSLELAAIILLRKKRRKFRDTPLFGAFIGITLSIIPLVLVLQVSEGMIFGIMNRYIETLYSHVMLRFYTEIKEQKIENLQAQIAALPGVQTSYNERSGTALLLARGAAQALGATQALGAAPAKGKKSAVQVRALESHAFTQDTGLQKYLTPIDPADLPTPQPLRRVRPGTILLASDVAFRLQIEIGDEVALLTGARFGPNSQGTLPSQGTFPLQGANLSNQLRPKAQKFVVAGILSTGYQELDRLWAFISYSDAQKFFHRSNSELLLHIKLDDPFDLAKLEQSTRKIESLAAEALESPVLSQVSSWYSQAADLRQSYQFTKSIMVYIMYLIVAVGAMNIAASMILLVLENSAEIAIMKTFGASRTLIGATYIWVAILVGSFAIFCGVGVGVLLCIFINEIIAGVNAMLEFSSGIFRLADPWPKLFDKSYYLEQIPVQIQAVPLVAMGGIVLLLTFLCSIIPALKAANMLPLSILHHNRD